MFIQSDIFFQLFVNVFIKRIKITISQAKWLSLFPFKMFVQGTQKEKKKTVSDKIHFIAPL